MTMTGFWSFIADALPAFLGSILGGGSIWAGLNWWHNVKQEKDRKNDAREFLSIQLAVLFEDFATECTECLYLHNKHITADGFGGKEIKAVPKLPTIPKSEAYKFLDRTLLDTILQFPSKISLAEKKTQFLIDVGGNVEQNIAEDTAHLGMNALELAKDIRQKNMLNERALEYSGWRVEKTLQNYIREFEEQFEEIETKETQ